jgi:hypothetical protein
MRKKLWLVGLAVTATIAAVIPLAASGGNGGHVMIAERNLFTGPNTQAGTFHMAGALSDSGPVTAVFTVTPSGDGTAVLEGDHTMQGADGTLVVRTRARVWPFPAARVTVKGTWTVVSGTRAYAHMHGGGEIRAVGDFTNNTATILRDGVVSR